MRSIIPQPGYSPQDIKDLLETRQFVYADCYTITPTMQPPIRLTTAQMTTTLYDLDNPHGSGDPVSFEAFRLLIKGLRTRQMVGVEVDEQDIELLYPENYTFMGKLMGEAIRIGRFDGSLIRKDRFFAKDWGDPWLGGVRMFQGRFSTADRIGRSSSIFRVRSRMLVLGTQMPKHVFQPGCSWTFGSAGCKFDRSAQQLSGSVGTGSTRLRINFSGITAAYNQGTVYMEDSNNFSQNRTISHVVPGSHFDVVYPFDAQPQEGDKFLLLPGCARTYAACQSKGNQAQYRGYPFVPIAEVGAGV